MGGNEAVPNGLTEYLARTPEPADERQAIAIAMSITRNLSIPFSVNPPDAGRWSGTYATIYRTIANSTNRLYFCEVDAEPGHDLGRPLEARLFRGRAGEGTKVSDNKIRVGDVSGEFIGAKPFAFLPEQARP